MQRLCKTEDFHDRRCQRYQPRWIRNRLADSLADRSRCVRWTVVYQICYLSTFFCRSWNRHAPIFYSSVLSSKSRLRLHARRTKQIIRKAGGQSSSAPLHQIGAIIPTHESTTGRRFREGCDFSPLHHAYCTRTGSIRKIGNGISQPECVCAYNRHSACKAVYLCDSGETTVECVRVPCVRQVSRGSDFATKYLTTCTAPRLFRVRSFPLPLTFSTLLTKQTVSQNWCLGKDSHRCRLWTIGLECFSRVRCFEEPEASWSELITVADRAISRHESTD